MARSRRSLEKESFWRLATDEHRRSGLSVRDFCEREGLSAASFYAWRHKLGDRDAGTRLPAGDRAELIPVAVVGSESHSRCELPLAAQVLEVITPGGFALRFPADMDPSQLDRVLNVVSRPRGAAAC